MKISEIILTELRFDKRKPLCCEQNGNGKGSNGPLEGISLQRLNIITFIPYNIQHYYELEMMSYTKYVC